MFSVVIPLYNKEKYILRAVESVLNQSYKKFELIVVDDGSTDNSLKSLRGILDPRVRVISQTNQGVGAARNKGMTEAKYEWIAFLDADDAWITDHLNELHNIIKGFPNSGMISTKVLEIKDSEKLPISNKRAVGNTCFINYFYEAAKDIGVINSSSVAINQKALNEIGGFSTYKVGEDLELWAKIAFSYPVAISDKVTGYYFRDTNGAMKDFVKEKPKKSSLIDNISLHNISPSVRFLMNEAKKDPKVLKDFNIRLYINSRLINGVKGGVFNKDFSKANSFAKLALPQLNRTYAYMLIYSLTPNPLLSKVYNCYLYIKR